MGGRVGVFPDNFVELLQEEEPPAPVVRKSNLTTLNFNFLRYSSTCNILRFVFIFNSVLQLWQCI